MYLNVQCNKVYKFVLQIILINFIIDLNILTLLFRTIRLENPNYCMQVIKLKDFIIIPK